MRWPWQAKSPAETRDLDADLAARALDIAAGQPVDMTRLSVAEACAGVYARGFAAARVEGADMLTPETMAMIGRALLFHGEFAAALTADVGLVPASSIDVFGRGTAPEEWRYRLFLPSPSGSEEIVASADSVLHVRIGASRAAPWRGRSPLAGAMTDAELALAVATGLKGEAKLPPRVFFGFSPAETGVINPDAMQEWADRVRKMEAGKPVLSPYPVSSAAQRPEPAPTMDAARRTASEEIAAAAGVPMSLLRGDGDGAAQREAYRRLTRATLEPLGRVLAHEAALKLGQPVTVDFAPLRGSDTAMQARAFGALAGAGVPVNEALRIAGLVETDS